MFGWLILFIIETSVFRSFFKTELLIMLYLLHLLADAFYGVLVVFVLGLVVTGCEIHNRKIASTYLVL